MEWEPIEHVWIDHDDDLVNITISWTKQTKGGIQKASETIHTNKKHPFFTQEAGFVQVAHLHVGMHILKADGSTGEITSWTAIPGTETMYNLQVAQDHTFTVGEQQWIVHNCTANPNAIGFTQDTVTNQGNGYTVTGNIKGLQDGTLKPGDLPKIQIFQATPEMEDWKMTKNGYTGRGSNLIPGEWYTLNNRRLYAYQQAGITNIPVEVITDPAIIKAQTWQFTTTTWGIDATLKMQK